MQVLDPKVTACTWKMALCAVCVCADAHAPQRTSAAAETRPLYTTFFVFNPFGAFWGQFTPLGQAFTPFYLLFSPFSTPVCQFWHPFTPFWHICTRLFVTFYCFLSALHLLERFLPLFGAFLRRLGTFFFFTLLTHINPFRPLLNLPYKAF